MHLRKLTFTVGLVGALCSTWAYGLGLGEIKLNSSLNQPLDAEIKLLQVRNLTEEDILVELAASEDFQRFGVDRIFFLQNLKFDVQLDHPGGPVVRVTTAEPVREPYLIFLLHAQSPSGGRLLREYTLLMDLPVYADTPARPVQGAQSGVAQQAAAPAPLPSRRTPASESAAPAAPVQRQGEPPRAPPAPSTMVTSRPGVEVYGPVQPNDTLWEIAERVRPSNAVSVQQTMLALQRANPDAFINGNINLLKRGQVLRVPDESEFQALDQRTALSEVAVQNDRWTAAREGQVAGAELQASSSRPVAAGGAPGVRGELTIAAPGDPNRAGERSGAGDSNASTEALENELAITAEQLDATRRENADLSARVAELEAQITTMERLIEVSSEELRTLQLATEQSDNSQANGSAEATSIATEGAAATADAELSDANATEAASEPNAEAANTASAAAESEPSAAPVPAPVAQPEKTVVTSQPASKPGILDLIMANLWYLLVAVLAILGGVVYFLHRRSQNNEWDSFEAEDDTLLAQEDMPEDSDLDEPAFAETMEADDEEAVAFDEDPLEADESVEAETGDAVGEADIYIAYGKYDQAEDMLQKAIVNEPGNVAARLKLLEVYAETRDVEKFDRQYGHLQALGDASASSRGAELRSTIPGAGEYSGEAVATSNFAAAAESPSNEDGLNDALDFSSDDFDFGDLESNSDNDGDTAPGDGLSLEGEDFDLALEDDSVSLAAEKDSSSEDDGLGDLSFDLDDSFGASGIEAASLASENDDNSFDFDLELDSEEGDETEPALAFGDDPAKEKSAAETGEEGFEFELDLEEDLADSELTLDEEVMESDAEGDEFDIPELDSLELGSSESELSLEADNRELPSLDASDTDGEGFDLEMDFEAGLESDLAALGTGDTALDLSPEAQPEEESESDDDIFSDLEFNAAGDDEEESTAELDDALSDLNFGAATDNKAKTPDADLSDDGFDMDMDDLDLEALDQEMDALVGTVDDLGDDDVAVAAPTETLAAVNGSAKASAADDKDFDLDAFMGEAAADSGEEPSFDFGENQSFDEEEAGDLDSELDFLGDADEVATKLDLARAYIDMGDQDGARDILGEVSSEGSEDQKREAAELLDKIV